MCGISGFVCKNVNKTVLPNYSAFISASLDIMKERGPDGSGIELGNFWIFGHRRLAILDPQGGAQPCYDPERQFYITYNGEIYNYREIRKELIAKGHSFKSDCDTEVLLASYIEWGEDCLAKFNGFFSFAIADMRKESVFMARDRAGIKPFFYSLRKDGLAFASSASVLTKVPDFDKSPDLPCMSHFLSTGKLCFGESTLFREIKVLRPGHSLTFSAKDGSLTKKQYWRRPVLSPEEKAATAPDFKEASEKVASLLDDAVRMRLVSDVPLGAFLSGGIDSAIICKTAKKYAEHPLPLFCAGTNQEAMNEFHYAKEMADSIRCELEQVRISPECFAGDWNFLVKQKGLPLCTPNEISIYRLASALRKKCTVTLTGEGADEVFGGYTSPHFSGYDFDRCARSPETADSDSKFGIHMSLLYGRSFFINDTDHYLSTETWMPYFFKKDLLTENTWETLNEDEELFVFYEDFFESVKQCSSIDKRMHLHAEFNLENLLARVDSSTMSASVEARVPFTDYRLMEFAFKMPDSYKIDWKSPETQTQGKDLTVAEIDKLGLLETKKLPRHAFADKLPESIIKRPKMSFPVPFQEWFSGPMKDEIIEICRSSDFYGSIFKKSSIDKMLANSDRNLWLIANLCKWRSLF